MLNSQNSSNVVFLNNKYFLALDEIFVEKYKKRKRRAAHHDLKWPSNYNDGYVYIPYQFHADTYDSSILIVTS